jgi:hypothetical protein
MTMTDTVKKEELKPETREDVVEENPRYPSLF